MRRRREDAVIGGRVGYRIADDFSYLDAARLVQEEHVECARLTCESLLDALKLWPVLSAQLHS